MNHSLSFRLRKVAIVFGSAAVGMLIAASTHAAENPGYIEDPSRRTTGIGKFYMGREISFVMGHQAAGWLNRPGRIQEEMPDEVVANMGLEPDHVVADIGAGSGYFSFRIAKLVPEGKVLAVDIQQEMLDIIEATKATEGVTNIDGVKGEIDNPNLPANSIDAAIMVDAYHEFSYPREVMLQVAAALRPGGKVVLIEYRGEDPAVPIKELHKMTQQQARRELAAAGLAWVETRDILPQQHFMVFAKATR